MLSIATLFHLCECLFQALLTHDLAFVEDNDGKTVMHIAAEMGELKAIVW